MNTIHSAEKRSQALLQPLRILPLNLTTSSPVSGIITEPLTQSWDALSAPEQCDILAIFRDPSHFDATL